MKHLHIPSNVIKIAAFAVVVALVVYFFPGAESDAKFHFQEGKPWNYGLVTAPYDFPIYKTAEQIRQDQNEVLRNFTPYFRFVPDANKNHLIVSLQDMTMLQQNGYQHISIINGKRVESVIACEQLLTPKTAFLSLGREMSPTLQYDSVTSQQMKAGILSDIAPTEGMVQKGEKVIDKGEIVTSEAYQMLISLMKADEEKHANRNSQWANRLGAGLMAAFILGIFVVYLLVFRKRIWVDTRAILLFCMLMSITVVGAFLTVHSEHSSFILSLLPFTWVPIIARVFYDSRSAMMLHITTILIVSLAVTVPYQFVVIQLCAGAVVIASLKDMSQRAQLATTAGLTLLTMSAVYTCLMLVTNGSLKLIDWHNYLAFIINAMLVICVYGLVYLIEKMFHLVSNLTLVELANINSNLMHDFAERAPGTFQHSLQVSNLATEAAKRIGAKVQLVRTGALYHDLGKLAHPQLFTENQGGGPNPLMMMSNREAAQTVIQHVRDGEQLARKRHLPEAVIHFITTHHGTSLVRYFYNSEALKNPDEQVDEADFRYPGPQPDTKETAILMMADAVEARSRSLNEYTEASIRAMVNDMIETQVRDGQFAHTPLSFRDVEQIKQVFIDRLIIMNHHRIQYPTLK